jgi:hypothetical protein
MSGDLIPPPNSGISPEDWQQTPVGVLKASALIFP